MTTKIIKFYRPELIGESNLVMRLHLPGRSAIVNGTGTSATIDAAGLITANITETLTRALYAVTIYDSVAADFLWTPDSDSMLWMTGDGAGTYYAGSHALSEQVLAEAKNPEAPKRALGDISSEDFTWIVSNASSNAITATKVFEGQLTPTSVAGTFTYIGIVFGDYRWSFTPGTGDLPTVAGPVTYQLTDTLGNTGKLTIVMVEAAGTISSTVLAGLTGVVPTIISPWEPITRTLTLIRGNDYVDALGTAIKIAINVPSGLNVSTAIPTLYASHKVTSDKFVSVGTFYQVSGNNFVKFEISAIETIGKIADYYEFFIQAKAGSYLTTLVAESKLRLVKNIESV